MNIYKTIHLIFTIILLGSFLISCEKEIKKVKNVNCNRNISFSNDVMPIIEISCNNFACHSSSNSMAFPLSSHTDVSNAVYKFNLLESIKHQTMNPMPRIDPYLQDAYKLNDSVISIIECWINQGLLNN